MSSNTPARPLNLRQSTAHTHLLRDAYRELGIQREVPPSVVVASAIPDAQEASLTAPRLVAHIRSIFDDITLSTAPAAP